MSNETCQCGAKRIAWQMILPGHSLPDPKAAKGATA